MDPLDLKVPPLPEATMVSMAATAATGFIAPRQHGGNSNGVSSSPAGAVDSASRLHSVTAGVAAEQENGISTDAFGSTEPYRYSVSSLTERSSCP